MSDEIFEPVTDRAPDPRKTWRARLAVVSAVVIVALAAVGIILAVRSNPSGTQHAGPGGPVKSVSQPPEGAAPPDTDGPLLPAGSSPTSPGTADSGSASSLVLADGALATGEVSIEAATGHPTLLCPPYPNAGVGSIGPQPYQACEGGIPVTGLDLAKIQNKVTVDGVTTANASVTGHLASGSFTVTKQGPYTEASGAYADKVPCQAPPGGWPRGTADYSDNLDTTAIESYQSSHPGTVISYGLLRPASGVVLAYVISAGDPAPVRAALAPTYGNDLCVSRSVYSQQQIDSAYQALLKQQTLSPTPSLTTPISVGQGWSPDEQPNVDVQVPVLTDQLAALIDAQPAGLVTVTVWLSPVT